MKPVLLLASLALLVPFAADAGRVDTGSTDASSFYPEENGIQYDPGNAVDGKLSTAWVEGDSGSGLGSWLQIDLGGEQHVHRLKVWGGMWYSSEYWERTSRPRELEVKWSDGSTESFPLDDEMKVHVLDLSDPKPTSSVRLRIKQVYSGNTWLDTAISEVQVFDASPGDEVAVGVATASSQAAPDADGSYDPHNVYDGLSDSMWCEGDAEGDGTGEWLEFRFDRPARVGAVEVINGIGTSLPYWMKGNRASSATLTFADGTSESISIKNSMFPQTIEFPSHQTTSVKVTFTGITAGNEYNDLCISELAFR